MNLRIGAAALLVAAGALVSCGGGGGGGGSASRIEGLLEGASTRSSTQRGVIAYASEGRFMAAELASDGYFFDGEYTISGGSLSGSARIYGTSLGLAHARYFTQTATLTGTATDDDWQVTITGASSTTALAVVHQAKDTQNSSLSAVQGTWVYDPSGSNTSTLTIASDGATSSTNDSGCASNGSVATIDRDYTLYDSATTVTDPTGNCPNSVEGSYTGLIALFDYIPGNDDQLVVMLAKPDFMLFYPYTRQP